MRKRINKQHTALFVPLLVLTAGQSPAQDEPVSLTMNGTEQIDPKERISGGALVGMNFLDTDKTFNPNDVFVSFDVEPCGHIKTQLTTVDGRYVFTAQIGPDAERPPLTVEPVWLDLNHEDEVNNEVRPLRAKFLDDNYNQQKQDREIAVLVTDQNNRAFPVRWGSEGSTDMLRIRVNAEGADAYFVRLDDEDKPHLVKCEEASKNSQFKFDHICDMSWQDVQKIAQKSKIQIIRKRGATYESPIEINVLTTGSDTTLNSEDCVDQT